MRIASIAVLLAALGACQRPDMSICKPLFDERDWEELPVEIKKELRHAIKCVRQESYRLSVADGSPHDVAEAAIKICSDAIELFVLTGAQQGLIEEDEVSKQLENERGEFTKFGRSYVIQAWAGGCQNLEMSEL